MKEFNPYDLNDVAKLNEGKVTFPVVSIRLMEAYAEIDNLKDQLASMQAVIDAVGEYIESKPLSASAGGLTMYHKDDSGIIRAYDAWKVSRETEREVTK